MMTKLNRLINRIQTISQDNAWLDNEADALIGRLQQYKLNLYHAAAALPAARDRILLSTTPEPFSDELVEYLANDQQSINIILDDLTLDYQTHILPCLSKTSLAVRFTDSQPHCYGPYVLTFTLMSPGEKMARLINRYPSVIREDDFRHKLTELEDRKLPESQGIIDPMAFLSAAAIRGKCLPSSQSLSPVLMFRASELAPFLDKEDLTHLLSSFWGDDPSAISQWLQYLHTKDILKNAPQVIAPTRAIIATGMVSDQYSPLSGTEYGTTYIEDIPICPLADGIPLPAISLPRQNLFDISKEVTLTIAHSTPHSSCKNTVIFPADPYFAFSGFNRQSDNVKFRRQKENDASLFRTHLDFLCRNEPFTKQETEDLLRTLQTRSDRHGELLDGLIIDESMLKTLSYPSASHDESSVFPGTINLLDDVHPGRTKTAGKFAAKVYQLWINHIRDQGFNDTLKSRSGLTARELSMLSQIVIQASYEANLQEYLMYALEDFDSNAVAGICCATRVLNEFITWLGYNFIPSENRPLSKMNTDSALFTPPDRVMNNTPLLCSDNTVSGNIIWLGDWLIALSNRAVMLPDGYGLTAAQRKDLNKILSGAFKDN